MTVHTQNPSLGAQDGSLPLIKMATRIARLVGADLEPHERIPLSRLRKQLASKAESEVFDGAISIAVNMGWIDVLDGHNGGKAVVATPKTLIYFGRIPSGMLGDYRDEALSCLRDLEAALRIGNFDAALHGLFIWSQRRDAIMAGEEDWSDQHFSPSRSWIGRSEAAGGPQDG